MSVEKTEAEWLFDYNVRLSSTIQGVSNKVKIIAYSKTEASEKFVKYISTTYEDISALTFYVTKVVTDSAPEVPAWLVECNGGLYEVGAPTLKEVTMIYTNWMFDKYPNTSELSLTIRKMPEKVYINK